MRRRGLIALILLFAGCGNLFADYTIDFGDGTSATISAAPFPGGTFPAIAAHSYLNNGIYAVTLSAEVDCDGDGLADPLPVTGTMLVNVGGVRQAFDFGDGSPQLTDNASPCTTPPTPSHVYSAPGSYQATYRALDDGGNLITASIRIDVAGAGHFAISHDGTAINCQAEPVTISAHGDAHLPLVGYQGTIHLSTKSGHGDWSLLSGVATNLSNLGGGQATYTFNGTENGVVILGLRDTTAELVDIDVTDGSASEDPVEDPALDFAATGFNFLADGVVNGFAAQTAGKSSTVAPGAQVLELQAIRTSDATGACEAALVGPTTVELAYECLDPPTCQGNLLALNGQSVAANNAGVAGLGYAGIALDFGSAARNSATFNLNYADVGALRLHARYQLPDINGNPSGLYMLGTSGPLVFRPARFGLSIPGNPAAADSNGTPFKKGGEPFAVQVRALNANGGVTPNYGREASAETVRLESTLVAPSGANNPALDGSFNAFGTDCDGKPAPGVACGRFSWHEVGIIDLLPGVGDRDYLGVGDVSGDRSGNVGRFVAARLLVSPNTPSLANACVSGSFTYLGQEFPYLIDPRLTVAALGSDGAILRNYGYSFWKYAGTLAARSYADAAASAAAVGLTTTGSTVLAGQDNYDGTGIVTLSGDLLTFAKPVSPVAPFPGNVDLRLTAADLTDTDGACFDPDDDGLCDPLRLAAIGTTEQRYGRMVLQNAYGPEVLDLTLPLAVEYFTGSGYAVNALDDCTPYAAANLVLSNYQDHLSSGATTPAGNGILAAGTGGGMTLSAPGVGKQGSVDLLYDLAAAGLGWLKDKGANPTAKATFGIYQGNPRLIYLRESLP